MLFPYRLAAYGLAVISLIAGVLGVMHHEYAKGELAGRSAVQAQWDKERAAQQAAALKAEQENAQETARRIAEQKEAQDAYEKELSQARADAANAHAAVIRLRSYANSLARSSPAPIDPAPSANSQTTHSAEGMPADLLGRLGERAELLASYADAARRAGQQCERDYKALEDRK